MPVTDYKIAAIPTEYRGRRYRSRLEARWAEFFGCLGFDHKYEPFYLKGWLPDFQLPGVLVEVKPHDYWEVHPKETWAKISRAAYASDRREDILLTRAHPDYIDGLPCVGWAGQPQDLFDRRHAYILRDGLGYRLVKADRSVISCRAPDLELCSLIRFMWDSTAQQEGSVP